MIVSLAQTLLDRFRAKKHLRESDEGDRVGAGATHVFSPLELLGMDDPAVPVHVTLIWLVFLLCCMAEYWTWRRRLGNSVLCGHAGNEIRWRGSEDLRSDGCAAGQVQDRRR